MSNQGFSEGQMRHNNQVCSHRTTVTAAAYAGKEPPTKRRLFSAQTLQNVSDQLHGQLCTQYLQKRYSVRLTRVKAHLWGEGFHEGVALLVLRALLLIGFPCFSAHVPPLVARGLSNHLDCDWLPWVFFLQHHNFPQVRPTTSITPRCSVVNVCVLGGKGDPGGGGGGG